MKRGRYFVHTDLQSPVGRPIREPHRVVDRETNSTIDYYASKRAAQIHARTLNIEDRLTMKTTNTPRRSRRYAVALLFAADVSTFEPYQPGRTRIPVYVAGDYFVALRSGERAPEGFGTWQKAGDSCGYVIMIATGGAR